MNKLKKYTDCEYSQLLAEMQVFTSLFYIINKTIMPKKG